MVSMKVFNFVFQAYHGLKMCNKSNMIFFVIIIPFKAVCKENQALFSSALMIASC